MENEENGAKSATALRRCAKAALLLSALKSTTNSGEQCRTRTISEQEEEEEEVIRSEIQDLKIQLLKERLSFKKMKFRGSVTVLVLLLLVLFLSALLLLLFISVINFQERVIAD